MIALDTTFLLDYLDGEPAAKSFVSDRRDQPFFAPALSLFEVYRGAARSAGSDGLTKVVESLDWVEPLSLTEPIAREAATVEAELLDSGTPVNLGDVLIAGICRHHGATLVTRDGDFERVDGLDVIEY